MLILIVEDDRKLARFLNQGLAEEGFEVAVEYDGERALAAAIDSPPDLILLDVMLPGRDGLEVCRALRERGVTVPIVMLTVRTEVEDRIAGLRAGADDYLGKPFAFDELLARIRAQLRRTTEYEGRRLGHADLELDTVTRTAHRAGQPVELTGKEFALLEYLLRHRGRAISEEELIREVWGMDFDPGTNVVNVYVHHLRSKVDREHGVKLIHTVRGEGYRIGEPEDG